MTNGREQPPPAVARRLEAAEAAILRESGLARQLSSRQMAMIAIGGAIGTGLFLGSSLAVHLAGPVVILSYLLGAALTLLLMGALSEMAVAHPTAGSFGVYAELYIAPWAGFVVRYTYWAAQCIAIGGEATAAAIYCRWWFPATPEWMWIVGFAVILLVVNARGVGSFGEIEYWFAMIKVVAIVAFIIFGAVILLGWLHGGSGGGGSGLRNFTIDGGFMPHGWTGMWAAMCFVIFSYIGTEVVAVTAGEAKDPEVAVPLALRSMVGRLIIFYIGAMVVLIGVVPWNEIQPGAQVTASPFVTVFRVMHIPAATNIMNFVVLTAALSSMNCDLYLCARMLFSLARGGEAPAILGRVSKQGTPLAALLVSSAGLGVATAVAALYPGSAFVYLFGVSLFGGLFVWGMIFITHLRFRRMRRRAGAPPLAVELWGYPYTSWLGTALIVGILVTTWWVAGMRPTLVAGLPWLALLLAIFYLRRRRTRSTAVWQDGLPE